MQDFIGWPCPIDFIGESCGNDGPQPPGGEFAWDENTLWDENTYWS